MTGSLGLLRVAVERGRLTPAEAMVVYERMHAAGAFLPRVTLEIFERRA